MNYLDVIIHVPVRHLFPTVFTFNPVCYLFLSLSLMNTFDMFPQGASGREPLSTLVTFCLVSVQLQSLVGSIAVYLQARSRG